MVSKKSVDHNGRRAMRQNTSISTPSARRFLDAAYSQLEFDLGALRSAEKQPRKADKDWMEKGDWQALAAQVGAEKLFFVGDNPVVVFAALENRGEQTLRKLYQCIWCMARPPLLFLARPGELCVYDLAKPPPRIGESIDGQNRLVRRVTALAEVQTELARFHRDQIETGAIFGDERFAENLNRADRSLIRDLKLVKNELSEIAPAKSGAWAEKLSHLHSLLGRCIFARYLEDRHIINRDYFEKVADRDSRNEWQRILDEPLPESPAEPWMSGVLFLRVLRDKNFTYAFFDQLTKDFNGDAFPVEDGERERIHAGHLDLLRSFLCGAPMVQQTELFFYAYRFEIIPIELISSIYEEFYNERTGKGQNQGSHYTPPPLVEFVLSQTLTKAILDSNPVVCDPACGSGIFLVESFRRIVRHRSAKQSGKAIMQSDLRAILHQQIRGIDLNPEAVRVAAFSLYLAFLHYQDPREINEHRRLPHLIWVDAKEQSRRRTAKPGAQFLDILFHGNAFDVICKNVPSEVENRFGPNTAEVVVGNPPWGFPTDDDDKGKQALVTTLKWCKPKLGRPVGDKELSQAFVHLSLELLKDGGRAGMLLSAGVLFKEHSKSQAFRRKWLGNVKLQNVVNFSDVRSVFFSEKMRETEGISPFISTTYIKAPSGECGANRFAYWSIKYSAQVEKNRCVVLNSGDMHYLKQSDCLRHETLWKTYWWGGRRDAALALRLRTKSSMAAIGSEVSGASAIGAFGFVEGKRGTHPSKWLREFRELEVGEMTSYGPLDTAKLLTVPSAVRRRGKRDVYEGTRLLFRRGVPTGGNITVRLETEPCCFRHSIFGFRLKGLAEWQSKILIAICWSSLCRYYLACCASSWGPWHDAISKKVVQEFPICFPTDIALRNRIVRIVDELRSLELKPNGMEMRGTSAQLRLPSLERELDDAIFNLYELDTGERDLIRDMCDISLDYFYRGPDSSALLAPARPLMDTGIVDNLRADHNGLDGYLTVLLAHLGADISSREELAWRIVSPPRGVPIVAVLVEQRRKSVRERADFTPDVETWGDVLSRLAASSKIPIASRVLVDTFYRYSSKTDAIIIKRNEARFWTRSAAREDAEAIELQRMIAEEEGLNG